MNFLASCRQLIALESTPTHGTLDVARKAAQLCHEADLQVEVFEDSLTGVPQANVVAQLGDPQGPQGLMLQSHLDTVDPGPYSLWTKNGANPFNATIMDNAIYGIGAADAKLDFLCKLRALSELRDQKFKRSAVLVGTYGEELGMAGATKLIRRKQIRPRVALVGEATNLRLVHAAKGIAGVEIALPFSAEELRYKEDHDLQESTSSQSKVFTGRSAHSAHPSSGNNAILKMLQHLIQLPTGIAVMNLDGGVNFNSVPSHAVYEIDLVGTLKNTVIDKLKIVLQSLRQIELEFLNFKDEAFLPAEPTLMIGMIRTYADQVVITGNFRWPPKVSDADYKGWMAWLKKISEAQGGHFRLFEVRHPFETSTASEFARICQDELAQMGLSPMAVKHSSCSEANLFNRLNIECLTFGPGHIEDNIHTPFEHVKLNDLEIAVEFYKRVITKVCL